MQSKDMDEYEIDIDDSEQFMTVFFLFDSVLQNNEIESQAAIELFKKIQSESLQ